MPVKINVGLAKKIGQPDYGSLGATCNVEFDLDGGFDNGSTERFQDAVRRAYTACREAVEAEIDANRAAITSPAPPLGGQHNTPPITPYNRVANQTGTGNGAGGNSTGSGNGSTGSGGGRGATSSQVRAIFAIANRSGVDLPGLLHSQYSVGRPDDLSIRDASSLIDQLKGGSTNGNANNNANNNGNAVQR